MNLKSGFGKAGVGFCVSPTWSLNNMSDFHQLCLEFWPRPSGTINHYMSAHCSCHCASWAGTKKCNNWREISSSKLQCPTVHPNTHPHLPPATSKLPFVDICISAIWILIHFIFIQAILYGFSHNTPPA